MLTMLGSRRRCCDGLTRRETLKAGALALAGGFHLPGLLRAEEARGEFRPIATSAPGVRIGEHLPLTACWMHRAALVRSVNHRSGCHNPLPSYTGFEGMLSDIVSTRDSYPPSMGSVCEYLKYGR